MALSVRLNCRTFLTNLLILNRISDKDLDLEVDEEDCHDDGQMVSEEMLDVGNAGEEI